MPTRILVIDADPQTLHMTSRLLRGTGYHVITGTSSDDALRLAQEYRPDLVLLATALGASDGCAVCRQLKADPTLRRTRVVLVSYLPAAATDDIIHGDVGADGYLVLPAEHRKVIALLRKRRAKHTRRRAHHALSARLHSRTQALRRATAALDGNEAILRSFFHSPDSGRGIVEVVDGDLRHLVDNMAAATVFDRTPASMHNQFASALGIPQASITCWLDHCAQSRLTQAPVQFTCPYRIGTRTRWLSVTVDFLGIAPSGCPRYTYTAADITERTQAEEMLRIRDAAIESALTGHVIVGLDGRLRYANPAAGVICGYAGASAGGQQVTAIWQSPHDVQAILDALQHTGYWMGELTGKRADGSDLVLELSASLVRDARQQPLCMQASFTDITKRKEAERLLRESEERFASAMHGVTDGLWDWNLETDTVYYSPRWKDMLGYAEDDIEHRRSAFVQLLHPDDRAWVDKLTHYYLEGHVDKYAAEFQMRHKEGHYVDILSRAFAVGRGVDGKPQRLVGTHVDITFRKHAELKVKYRVQLENTIAALSTRFINCPAMSLDKEITDALGTIGSFARADRAFLFLLSDDQQYMTNTHEWCAEGISSQIDRLQQFPTQRLPWALAQLSAHDIIRIPRVADLPPEASAEKAHLEAQGIQSMIALPLIEQGALVGFLGFDAVREEQEWPTDVNQLLKMAGDILTNALARKKHDERVRQLQGALERRITELDAANKELEAFTYSVSHDLRAPLWHITSFIDALAHEIGEDMPDDVRDLFQRIQHASQHMTDLIDALLTLSRLSREAPSFINLSLSVLAQEIMTELQQEEPERHVTVTIMPEMHVVADPRLMHIALENLLTNAWKYTSKRQHARIEVGVMRHAEETVYYIRDNGAGFNMAHADRLFIPFQRLHRARDFPGTGIGLATVQRIIQRHGGRVWAEGKVDHGATLYFTLHSTDTSDTPVLPPQFYGRDV